ncbi:MAG: cytochrome d ubiquinol oxidase subunit II [Actinomycetales bacterium]|nr:cytochrome d ubiquinol oxidase subunit II [Actinomycetales bacterium]
MDHATLQIIWFVLIAVLWTGYLFLEGFDFGVGMLLPVLGRNEKERRVMINTIGPVWDGNEVWLLTAGGATFAAFPEWYATLFSGFYLALLVILLALIARIVSFEWRGKINDVRWQNGFRWGLVLGSWIPAVLWGVAFGNIVRGVPLETDTAGNIQYAGTFFDLLNPFALLGGVTTAMIFLTHGAIFLALKTDGDIKERAAKLAQTLSLVTLVVAGAWAVWLQLAYSNNSWTWLATGVAAVALIGVVLAARVRREGWAFILMGVAIVGAVALIFGGLYPNVMPDIDGVNNLTVAAASSSQYTLGVMTWVAVALTPIVLAYQAWTYWVFRKRIHVDHIPEPAGLSLEKV